MIKNQLEIIKLNLLFWGLARSDKNPYHIKDVSMTTHNSFKYLGTSFITVMSFWQIRASIQSIMLILWFWFLILIYLEVCESSFIKVQFVWHYRFYQIQILKYLTLSAILMLMNAFNFLKSKGNIFLIPSQIGLLEFVSNHFMIIIVFEQDNFKIKRFLNLVLLL